MVPAAVRFLSMEPLLGSVGNIGLESVSWVIVGGESSPKARPMKPEWVRAIRELCARSGVPFFFKQWEARPRRPADANWTRCSIARCPHTCTKGTVISFRWHPEGPPLSIEPHSRARPDVLRSYLRAYFDRLNVSPLRDAFKLDLIHGFAGGGGVSDGTGKVQEIHPDTSRTQPSKPRRMVGRATGGARTMPPTVS